MRMVRLGAAALLVTTLLSGCDRGPTTPVADPTVHPPSATTATPTPTADPLAPAFLFVDAHGLGVGANNQAELLTIPYSTDIATAASQLSAEIGVTPVVTPVPATSCAPATARYDFGGIELYTDVPFSDTLGAAFLVSVTQPQTTGGLELDSADNQKVGTTLADVLAHVPGAVSGDRGEGNIEALIDPQDDGSWGVILHANAGVITDFIAPGYYLTGHGTCG